MTNLYGLEVNGRIVETSPFPNVLNDLAPEFVKAEIDKIKKASTDHASRRFWSKPKIAYDIRIRIVELDPKVKRTLKG